MGKIFLKNRPNTELVLADLAEISASSRLLEDIIDPIYVNCLTTSTVWALISTVESGADAFFYMGMIFVFFQLICCPTLEAVEVSASSADLNWLKLSLRTATSSAKAASDRVLPA